MADEQAQPVEEQQVDVAPVAEEAPAPVEEQPAAAAEAPAEPEAPAEEAPAAPGAEALAVPAEINAPQKAKGDVTLAPEVVAHYGFSTDKAQLISQNDVESIVKVGDQTAVVGNESLS